MGGSAPETGTPIAGTYIELFSCQLDDRTCLEVNVRIVMGVTFRNGEYRIDDLGSNALAIGTRGNNTILTWDSTDPDFPGFTESGTWIFTFGSDPDSPSTTFTKTSEFMQDQGSSGTCKGNGRLESEGEPDDVPAFMPPCIPQ
jgi:hypothetical protein